MALDVPRLTPDNIVELTRSWIRDHSELNRLLAGEETGDRLISTCVAKAIDYYNTHGAPITASLVTFPSLSLLMDLTVIQVLQSVIFIKMRNYLLFQDGGTINTEANLEMYERVLARMQSVADRQLDSVKLNVNIMGAMNGEASVDSEYGWLSGWISTFSN